jgi:hypothetical protein
VAGRCEGDGEKRVGDRSGNPPPNEDTDGWAYGGTTPPISLPPFIACNFAKFYRKRTNFIFPMKGIRIDSIRILELAR